MSGRESHEERELKRTLADLARSAVGAAHLLSACAPIFTEASMQGSYSGEGCADHNHHHSHQQQQQLEGTQDSAPPPSEPSAQDSAPTPQEPNAQDSVPSPPEPSTQDRPTSSDVHGALVLEVVEVKNTVPFARCATKTGARGGSKVGSRADLFFSYFFLFPFLFSLYFPLFLREFNPCNPPLLMIEAPWWQKIRPSSFFIFFCCLILALPFAAERLHGGQRRPPRFLCCLGVLGPGNTSLP